jgi:EmrB/QacA subfamily drug resistance transporter
MFKGMINSTSSMDKAAQSSQTVITISLMLGLFVSGLDTSIVNIMLPTLQSAFQVRADQIMMLATMYLTMMAALQLLFGRCADIFDAAMIFLMGIFLFMLGSIGCALSLSFGHILSGRVIQGIGGAMMAASFGALILSEFPRDRIGSILGAVIMVMSFGTIIGPPLGGYLAQHISWHWAFIINIPLCLLSGAALALHLGSRARPQRSFQENIKQLDLPGGILSIIMFTTLPLGLVSLAKNGWHPLQTGGLFGLFVCSLILFIAVEKRAETPLLQLAVFRDRSLTMLITIKVVLFMALNGILVIFPFFLTRSVGMSPSKAGMLMLANAGAMAVVTPLAGKLTDRLGGSGIMTCGSLGLLVISSSAFILPGSPSFILLATVLILFGAGFAAVLISSTAMLLECAPAGQEGVFSAMNSLTMSVGGSLGLSLFSYLYAVGAAGKTGPVAAEGGLVTALTGVTVCAALLLTIAVIYITTTNAAAKATTGTRS